MPDTNPFIAANPPLLPPQYSLLPWKVVSGEVYATGCNYPLATARSYPPTVHNREANAAFIVKAVNEREELLRLLATHDIIQKLHCNTDYSGTELEAKTEAVLAKAGAP